MANKDIEKISVVFNGIGTRDADLATKHVNVKKYTQHNPQAAEGVKGLRESISQLPEDSRPVTVVRFDAAYFGLFKCNLRRIADYPHLSGYLRDLQQVPGIADTVDFNHIKRGYYSSHPDLNPTLIVPVGPLQDLTAPHGREHLG